MNLSPRVRILLFVALILAFMLLACGDMPDETKETRDAVDCNKAVEFHQRHRDCVEIACDGTGNCWCEAWDREPNYYGD